MTGAGSDDTRRGRTSSDLRCRVWSRAIKRLGVLALCAVALTCLLFIFHFEGLHPDGSPDFVGLYAAGKILRQGHPLDLYKIGAQQKMEDRIFPHSALNPFDHLPYEAKIYEQLAYLPYSEAYVVWTAFNLGLVGLIFYLLRFTRCELDDNSRLVWVLACLPSVAGTLVQGQDSILLAFAFVVAYLALKRRRDFAAGLALGAGLFRFEIVIPFAFVFLLRRRWRFLSGLLLMAAVVLVASVVVVGRSGLMEYGKLIAVMGHNQVNIVHPGSSTFVPVRHLQPTLRGFLSIMLLGLVPSTLLFLLTLAGTLVLLCWASFEFKSSTNPSSVAFDLEFSLAVLAALLSSYFLFIHELTPLILVAFLTLGYESVARRQGTVKDRAGTLLWLLTALVPVVGSVVGFRNFGVLFVVLLGLMIWLWQELAALRKLSPSL